MATDSIERQDNIRTADKEELKAGDRLRADSQLAVAPVSSAEKSPFAPADRPNNYQPGSQIEMSNPFEDNSKAKHDENLEQLPILAIKAAAEGRSGIPIMSLGYSEQTRLGPALTPEAQRVFDAIAAQGFKPVIEVKENRGNTTESKFIAASHNNYSAPQEYVLKANWDGEHHPELYKLVLDNVAARSEAYHESMRSEVREKIANLPELVRKAATEGSNNVYLMPLDNPDKLDVHQQKFVEAIEAQGFIPAIVRESPDSNSQSWHLGATWEQGPYQQCTKADAEETATALDENKLSVAAQKFQNCGYNGAGLLVDQPRFQQFAQEVAAIEKDGTGLDLELHYTVGTGKAFVLNDLEIK